jgi:hypothetical protein
VLASPCLAVPWFPSLRSTVLVKIDTIPHAARVPSQEFVVPHFAPGRKFLEPLGVTESADHVVLRDLPDTGFEFVHSGVTTRQKEWQETTRKEEEPFPCPCHVTRSPVTVTSWGIDQTTCIREI